MAATACSVLSCSRGGRLGGELEGALNLVESLWRFAGDFLEWYGATAPDNRSPKSLRGLRSGGAQRVQIEHVHVNGRGRWITKDVQASADRPGNDRQVLEAVVSQSRSQRAAMTVKRPTSSAYGSPPRSEGHPHQAGSPNGSIAEAAAAMGVGARQIWGEWTIPPHSEVSHLNSAVVSAPLGLWAAGRGDLWADPLEIRSEWYSSTAPIAANYLTSRRPATT